MTNERKAKSTGDWVDLKSGMQAISLNCLSHAISYCQWTNESAILKIENYFIQNDYKFSIGRMVRTLIAMSIIKLQQIVQVLGIIPGLKIFFLSPLFLVEFSFIKKFYFIIKSY